MATNQDYYRILGVSKSSSASEIKSAYRQKALEFHPDRNKTPEAESKFKQVNEAYEILSNPEKKQAYDQFGHAAFQPGGPGGFGGFGSRTGRAGPFTYTYTTTGGNPFEGMDFGGFSDPFDIFESFFGGASPFRRTPRKTQYSLKIDLKEAFTGTEKTLIHQGKEYKIKIPQGSTTGTLIRFQDFDVTIEVKPHPQFKREGIDLIYDLEIPFTTAILGQTITVPTLEGSVKLKIRPGTQPNTLIRLRGQGMPHLRTDTRGDQYIRLLIQIPKSLTREQKNLLEKLASTLA